MIWILTFLSVVLLGFLIYLHYRSFPDTQIKSFYFPALFLKLGAGIILGVIYFQYYQSGDTLSYHLQASQWFDSALENPTNYIKSIITDKNPQDQFQGSTRSNFLIHLLVFFYFITGKSYWVSSLYFSFLSFASFWWLANIIVNKFPQYRTQSGLAFLWFPTIIFWSSGATKDSISSTCIMVLSAVSLGLIFNLKWNSYRYILVIPCLILLWILKYYYFIVLVPVLIIGILFYTLRLPKTIRVIIGTIFIVSFITAGGLLHPNLNVNKIASVIYKSNKIYSNISSSSNLITFHQLEPNLISVLKNYPKAVLLGLSQPFMDFDNNLFKTAVSVENLIIIILMLSALPNLRKILYHKYGFLVIIGIIYIIILSGALTLSSPNLGTLSRYKISFLPFLIFICSVDNIVIKKFSKFFIHKK